MNIVLWIGMGIVIAVSGGPITRGGTRRVDDKQMATFQRKAGLPLPPALRDSVLRRITSHERMTVAGGLLGVALGALGSGLLPSSWEGAGGVVVLASGGFGAASGGVLAVLTGLPQASTNSPRVARSTAIELADYLPRGWLASARSAPFIALLAGLIGFGLLWFLPRSAWLPGWLPVVPILVVLAVVATLTVWLVSCRVLESGQEAASDLGLTWDDLVRAQALRSLWGNVIALATFSIAASFAMVGDTVSRSSARAGAEQSTSVLGAVALVLACLLLLGLLPVARDWMGGTTLRHVLNRLWPDAPFRVSDPLPTHTDQDRVT